MQFLVMAHDYRDEKALERRLAARRAHLALGDQMLNAGKMLYGAALLDELEAMNGSVLICNFKSRRELDDWLKVEPYVTGKVWEKVEVTPCKVGPSFEKLGR